MRLGSLFGCLLLVSAMTTNGCSSPGGGEPTPTPDRTQFVIENGNFEVPAHSEFYQCWRKNIRGDGRGIARIEYTPGSEAVHHVIIAIDNGIEAEGSGPCDLIETDWQVLFAGGVESDPLDVPPGVAFPLGAGDKQIVFQIHYFNPFDQAIKDNTAAQLTITDSSEEYVNAALMFTGSFDFNIPAFANDYKVWGHCNVPAAGEDWHIFAVFPHMHQFGTHITMTHTPEGGTEKALYDGAWAFGDQPIKAVDETVRVYDKLSVDCTYNNPDGFNIGFGESSTEEMCFGFFFYYPALITQMLPCVSSSGEGF